MKQLYLEDLTPGLTFGAGPWVVDDAKFDLFAKMTGDAHPIHYDDDYVRKHTDFPKRLAHGMLLTSMTALGATPMSQQLEDSLVAFAGQGMRFLAPVFVDDTVESRFNLAGVDRRTGSSKGLVTFRVVLVNQDGNTVLEGKQKYLIRARNAAAQETEK